MISWLSLAERPIYRVAGVDVKSEQTWKRYSASVIIRRKLGDEDGRFLQSDPSIGYRLAWPGQ